MARTEVFADAVPASKPRAQTVRKSFFYLFDEGSPLTRLRPEPENDARDPTDCPGSEELCKMRAIVS